MVEPIDLLKKRSAATESAHSLQLNAVKQDDTNVLSRHKSLVHPASLLLHRYLTVHSEVRKWPLGLPQVKHTEVPRLIRLLEVGFVRPASYSFTLGWEYNRQEEFDTRVNDLCTRHTHRREGAYILMIAGRSVFLSNPQIDSTMVKDD